MRLPAPCSGLITKLAAVGLLATAAACAQLPATGSMPAATVVTGSPAAGAQSGGMPAAGPERAASANPRTRNDDASPTPQAGNLQVVGTPARAASAPDPRTQAERDYDALYGEPAYNPIADPTLPTPAALPAVYDPWEPYNRTMHRFNNFVDRTIARPLARFYVEVVPEPIQLGVRNFFSNLGQPVTMVNSLLQGKPVQAAKSLGRFALNTTLGIGGIFDPASDAKLHVQSEDFGQTLAIWGWERSRYLELPLFGPRTVRDAFGALGDAPLSPLRQVEADAVRIPLQGVQLVDVRVQLLPTDSLRAGAIDDYALVRDSWLQRRRYQIFGDTRENGEVALPAYLRDKSNPLVPAAAMPVMPTDN